MLGIADYIILMLIGLGLAAACRRMFKSFQNGGCMGCSGCKNTKNCSSCGAASCKTHSSKENS
ncbi:MAG: hypothetical protein Q4F21_01830 [Lachnospiraceae bacterium]|nr:hypothetical protein [Lachnospiraceae bacterium]